MKHNTTNTTSDAIPFGYCHCGCGKKTNIAQMTSNKDHITKGQPCYFLSGHGNGFSSPAKRFWSKVKIGNPDECWNWIPKVNRYGYGQFLIHGHHHSAARFAYELTNGPLPKELLACHKCNNRACCNPSHIYAGTQKENIQDCKQAGHFHDLIHKRGIEHHNAKLTEDDIRQIRDAYANGIATELQLAKRFNVTRANIYLIVRRKHWTHLP